jgi:mono/diheme cytochrome c family protein
VLSSLATGHKVGIAVVAGVFIAFALVSSFLLPAWRPQFPGSRVRLFVLVTVLLTAGMLATVIALAAEPKEERSASGETSVPAETAPATTAPATTTPAPAPASSAGDPTAGKSVFETAGCVSCHTLKAANATGTVGPNLDDAKPPAELVVDRVTNGKGVMPSFKGQLSEKQIQDVAAFVSSTAGQG